MIWEKFDFLAFCFFLEKGCVFVVICPGIVKDQVKEATSMGILAGLLSNCLQTYINSSKQGGR